MTSYTLLVSAETLFQSKEGPCWICGGQNATGTVSYPSISMSLHKCSILIHSFTLTFIYLFNSLIYYL